jgi:uncharacterized protein
VSLASEVLHEIHRLRARVRGVSGSLVATLDGLLIAQDTTGIEPEGVAALAAANVGLGQRVAATLAYGDLRDTMIRGSAGCVAVHTAGPRALLAVLATPEVNVARLQTEVGLTAERVAAIVEVLDVTDFADTADTAGANSGRAGPDIPNPGTLPRRRP